MRMNAWMIAVLAAGMAVPAQAQTEYHRYNIVDGGYRDRVLGQGLWRVTASSDASSGFGFAAKMAVYRSAELAKAAGYSHIQILKHKVMIRQSRPDYRMIGQSAELKVRGVHSPSQPLACEMKPGSRCMVYAADDILTKLGPTVLVDH